MTSDYDTNVIRAATFFFNLQLRMGHYHRLRCLNSSRASSAAHEKTRFLLAPDSGVLR